MKSILRIGLMTSLTVLLLSAENFGQTSAPLQDFQIWNDVQLTVPLIKSKDKKSDRLNLVLSGTLRLRSNGSRFGDERIGAALEFKAKPFLTVGGGYLYRAHQPYAGKKEMENRVRGEVTLEKRLQNFSIRNRTRLEYRFRSGMADSSRFRNRLTLVVPIKQRNKELFSVFVADEPYYDFSKKLWTRNEISAGVTKKFSPTFSLDVYYLLQSNKASYLKEVHALGTAFKFRIP